LPAQNMITVSGARRRVESQVREDLLPITPKSKPTPPYFFAHYPNGWTFMEGHGFVPTLCKYPAIPGVNGATLDSSGRVNLSRVKQAVASGGGTVIDARDPRLIREGETEEDAEFFDYVRFYPMVGGARFYIEPGQVPTITARGTVIWNSKEAHAVNIEFRKHLAASGIIRPIHNVEYLRLEDEAQSRVDRARETAGNRPELAFKVEAAEKQLEAIRAEWARLTEADATAASTTGSAKPSRRRTLKPSRGKPDA